QTPHDGLPSQPGLADDLTAAQHAANMFPNTTMVVSPGSLQFVMFEPVGADGCVMHMWYYFVGDAAAAPEHETARQMVYADFAAINAEDEDICQRLQQGRHCDAYDGGRLAPFWDAGTANFHRQIAAAIRGEGAFERRPEG
ncbi:MAG: RHO alpha subunit C-terminal catalytic domain-containing protein, partial [Alphaproteobacteria bacterium]